MRNRTKIIFANNTKIRKNETSLSQGDMFRFLYWKIKRQ